MAESYEAVIVGAGIVGAACAVELARAGVKVAAVEADVVGSGATAAGMGHVVVMDDSPAQLALTHYSQQLWDSLAKEIGAEVEYSRCGTVWIAADEEELAAAAAKRDLYAAHDIPAELLDAAALYQHEPELRLGLAGGLLTAGDSVVYPPRAAALLIERARKYGAKLIRGRATELLDRGVKLADGTTLRGQVIIANGSRCVDLDPELPVEPKKGHLVITDRYPGFVRHQLVELSYVKKAHSAAGDSVAFNVQPRPTGQLLIGSSRQPGVASRDVDGAMLAAMLRRSVEYLPRLGKLNSVRVWTGLRAATPDGLPLIGPHPTRPGVWLATGHEGLGITTSLATAKLLAAQFAGYHPAIPAEPYLPSRSHAEAAHA